MIVVKIRAILLKYQIGSLMAITFLFFSCSKEAVVGSFPQSKNTKYLKAKTLDYTPQQIFKGLFFAEGEVANLIPELRDFRITNFVSDPVAIQNISAMHDEVIKKFETENPGYLDSFKAVMNSGNQMQIESKLINTATLLNQTLRDFYAEAYSQNANSKEFLEAQEEFKTALENSSIDQQDATALANFTKGYLDSKGISSKPKNCGFAVVVVVAMAAVALGVVVWSVAVAIEGFFIFTTKSEIAVAGGHSLLKDKFINSIAIQLN